LAGTAVTCAKGDRSRAARNAFRGWINSGRPSGAAIPKITGPDFYRPPVVIGGNTVASSVDDTQWIE
jgi:hypothetical protein